MYSPYQEFVLTEVNSDIFHVRGSISYTSGIGLHVFGHIKSRLCVKCKYYKEMMKLFTKLDKIDSNIESSIMDKKQSQNA